MRDIKQLNKLWTILILMFSLVMLIGHVFGEGEEVGVFEIIDLLAFIFFPLGTFIGFILSLYKPYSGSLLVIFCMIIFFALIVISRSAYRTSPIFIFFTAPAIVNLYIRHKENK